MAPAAGLWPLWGGWSILVGLAGGVLGTLALAALVSAFS